MVRLGVELPKVFETGGEFASEVSNSNNALLLVVTLFCSSCVGVELVASVVAGLVAFKLLDPVDDVGLLVWDVCIDDRILVESVDDSSRSKGGADVPSVLSDILSTLVIGFAVLVWTTGCKVV